MALDDFLAADPDARRCLRFLVNGEGTLDDFIQGCYGVPRAATSGEIARAFDLPFNADEGRAFEEAELSEDELLAELRRLVDATPDADDPASAASPTTSSRTQGLDETDRAWLRQLDDLTSSGRSFEELAGEPGNRTTEFGPPPDAPAERIAVPADLVESIEASYRTVSAWGFVTDKDLADWLREATGA